MKKSQIIILQVSYDDEENKQPKNWNWDQIVGCEDCVEILNYSNVENEPARS